MTATVKLDASSQRIIENRLATGRFETASDVVDEALRMMDEREQWVASIDRGIMRGLADIEAGRVYDADAVFDELEAELASLAPQS